MKQFTLGAICMLAVLSVIGWFVKVDIKPQDVDTSIYTKAIEELEDSMCRMESYVFLLEDSLILIDTLYHEAITNISSLTDKEAKEAVLEVFNGEPNDKTILLLNAENTALKERETVLMDIIKAKDVEISIKSQQIVVLQKMDTASQQTIASLREDIIKAEKKYKWQRNIAIASSIMIIIIAL